MNQIITIATAKIGDNSVQTVNARDLHALTLQEIAKQKKVSVAWVIRDAAEKYIAEQWPLFANSQ